MVQQESKVVEREHRRGTCGLRPETIQRLNLRIRRVSGHQNERTEKMYTFAKDIRDKLRMTMLQPFGPGFTKEQAAQADSMDILCSSFKDDGDDYTMFILKDKDGKTITTARVDNY